MDHITQLNCVKLFPEQQLSVVGMGGRYTEKQKTLLDRESNREPLHHWSGSLPLNFPGRYPRPI